MPAASTESREGLQTVVLSHAGASSRLEVVPGRGGICTRFEAAGVPFLYLDEESLRDESRNVRGGIPVLFPISGRLPDDRYLSQGRPFRLTQHGFARSSRFSVLSTSATEAEASVTLSLRDSDESRALYPYAFEFRLTYLLRQAALTVTAEIENRSSSPLPHQLGFHPYFFVPLASKAKAAVGTRAQVAYDNRSRKTDAFLAPDFAEGEVDVHLLDHREPETKLSRGALPGVTLEMSEAFRCLVLWTLPGKEFICVEPWVSGAGALATGQGLRWVRPGATDVLSFTVR